MLTYYCLMRVPFGVLHPVLHTLHAPVHPTSFTALQRGQRISPAEEDSPHDGHGVVDAIYATPNARASSPPTRNARPTELAKSPAM